MTEILKVENLSKRYGGRVALNGVSFDVRAGEIVGLLGPNGAGKSTTVGIVCGVVRQDGGSVAVCGESLAGRESMLKRHIGIVPQELALFDDLSATDNLELFGALYGMPSRGLPGRAMEVLDMVGLTERARDKPRTFSGGMKRRLNIACALMHDPDLLLLDEPTAGVDPQSRNRIFESLEKLRAHGKALVYTTHYMEEAERLADRIVIVDNGLVVASGTLGELLELLPSTHSLELDVDRVPDLETLRRLPGVTGVRMEGSRLVATLESLTHDSAAVLASLASMDVRLKRLSSGRANLEDVFLSLTGRRLRD